MWRAIGIVMLLALAQQRAQDALERGKAAFARQNWDEAAAAFRAAASAMPDSAVAWKMLGMVYAAQEKYDRAVAPLQRACDLDAHEPGACYYLGRALYSLNRYDAAGRVFRRALDNDRANRNRILHGLALDYEAMADSAAAERNYRAAVASGDTGAARDFGMFLWRQGRSDEALAMLRKAGATGRLQALWRALSGQPEQRDAHEPAPVLFEATELPVIVRNGARGEKHQIETMLAGIAVLDYDNDGWPDVYISNGADVFSLEKPDSSYYNRLFHNNGDHTFTDVTERAGVAGRGYSMGVAAADYDNDGWTDLFVAGVGSNTLFHNRGDGTFEDVSEHAGLRANGGWTIAAGWFDYDNDGLLDLFVARYVAWDPATEVRCGDPRPGFRAYCHPKYYTALPNALYHNEGNGRFRDVSAESGIGAHRGKGMGIAFGDYDGDGRLDVFVANDTIPNFLFHNEGNGRFREAALDAGVAFNEDGAAASSMGADFRDYDNDGREDLFVSALTNERFELFRNLGKGRFSYAGGLSLIAAASLPFSGWSAGVFDLNNDGWKDVFTANGNVMDNAELISDRKSRQPNSVFLNRGNGAFKQQILPGEAFHRGAAFGDLDRDGRIDIAVTRLNQPPLVLWNRTPGTAHWLELRLRGTRSNRDGIGASVHVVTASGEQWNRVTTSTGFAASSEPMVHFGLGGDARASRIEIEWPSGSRQMLENVTADRLIYVVEEDATCGGDPKPMSSAERCQ